MSGSSSDNKADKSPDFWLSVRPELDPATETCNTEMTEVPQQVFLSSDYYGAREDPKRSIQPGGFFGILASNEIDFYGSFRGPGDSDSEDPDRPKFIAREEHVDVSPLLERGRGQEQEDVDMFEGRQEAETEASKDCTTQCVTRQARFIENQQPPQLPTDDFFELDQATTFCVNSKPAFEIGNHLLDFLREGVMSSIGEVNMDNYSIEADAFVNNVMCSLQISVYDVSESQRCASADSESQRFAVEFLRFGGHIPTFRHVYQKATQWLKDLGILVEEGPEAPPEIFYLTPIKLPEEAPVVNEIDLTPLYDMASCLHIPTLQSEAATALASMADEGLASKLCNKRTFDAIAELLKARALEVAYPTYHLLLHLAQQAEAATFFSVRLLTMIVDAAVASFNEIVRKELERAFYFAVNHLPSKSDAIIALEDKLHPCRF
mmetsp:Transcript_41934/g.78410  ORF Transcript_41934/g.78410 Transcript_41934/m.78410 type:complete len:435 (+) Transcript_41934:48-1352(+)